MAINLHTWTPADKPALMALCNAVDRTFLSDRLPYPYTEADRPDEPCRGVEERIN